jgi:hypothetical protein
MLRTWATSRLPIGRTWAACNEFTATISPSRVMNSTSYPLRPWTNTTVPTSPAFSPYSGRSTVKTASSVSSSTLGLLQRISGHEIRHILIGLNEPNRAYVQISSVGRRQFSVDNIALAKRRIFCPHHRVLGRMLEQGLRESLPSVSREPKRVKNAALWRPYACDEDNKYPASLCSLATAYWWLGSFTGSDDYSTGDG